MFHRRHFLSGAAALSAAALLPRAFAQGPGQTVIWSGFPAGGLGDQVTRPLLDRLKGRYPGTVLLDSKPGAGGRIAAEFVKRATPDGTTLLQVPSSPITLYPSLYRKLPYEPLKDFIPVTPLCAYTFSLTAGPGLPAEVRTVADLVKWARANPGSAHYGIPAAGSVPHFAAMMFAQGAGLKMSSVPYKGGAPLLTDLMGGQVPVAFNVVSEVLPHVRSGRLRSLAVASPQRWAALPETPTLTELGFKDLSLVEYLGWYAPAKTPMETVRRLNAAVQESLQTPEMQEVFTRNGLLALRESPEAFAARVRQDIERWGPIVKATGFSPDE
ncbi:Bug family tripartite tricarboxylate transporter substrate binding protein [Caldimonas tepidiphila]|uniref:Bug family tripartite tricarboxylate transporter substrate binding protein n=1 Tax=Caldimonas tepidiphila TaxID=2315841 RepID=UPI000E5A2106|nr:tripartite tricarboxylate transporter substrate-binding protein [Caldimonas tepidiphila]